MSMWPNPVDRTSAGGVGRGERVGAGYLTRQGAISRQTGSMNISDVAIATTERGP
jgi:hypothetical protein